MEVSTKDNIYLQREQRARLLREPLSQLAEKWTPARGDCQQLTGLLLDGFAGIPHCTSLCCVGSDGVQVSANVSQNGVAPEYIGRDRSQRPCMKEAVPTCGFLLSDAYT